MGIKVKPIEGKTFGAVVTGVKLANVTDETFAYIKGLFLKYALLVFPSQFLSDEQNIEFGKRFGRLEFGAMPMANQKKNADGTYGEILDVQVQRMRTNIGNEAWHTDSSYRPISSKCGILSAVAVPTHGGETGFADMRDGYAALDQPTKEKLEQLSAYHSTVYSQANDIGNFPVVGDNSISHPRSTVYHREAYLRPLIKKHPDTGVKNLFIGRHAFSVPGLSRQDSRVLLADLVKFAVSDERRVYHHEWQVGDTVVWDNRCLLHRARPYDYGQARVLTGTRIAGEPESELAYYPDSQEAKLGRDALAAELKLLHAEHSASKL